MAPVKTPGKSRQQKTARNSEQNKCQQNTAAFTAHVATLKDDASAAPALKALAAELHRGLAQGLAFDISQLSRVFLSGVEQDGFGSQLARGVALLVELIFADNSRALHRGVVAALRKLGEPHQKDAIAQVLRARILQEARSATHAPSKQQPPQAPLQQGAPGILPPPVISPSRIVLAQQLTALTWLPDFPAIVLPVSAAAVKAVVVSTDDLLQAAEGGQHIPPMLMDEIQDAVCALYVIMQKCGPQMLAGEGGDSPVAGTCEAPPAAAASVAAAAAATPSGTAADTCAAAPLTTGADGACAKGPPRTTCVRAGEDALLHAAMAMLRALQGRTLVREAMAAAAVVVWAAALCPATSPPHLVASFVTGLVLEPELVQAGVRVRACTPAGGALPPPCGPDGFLEASLRARGSSLELEISRFSQVSKICTLKGLITALPPPAANWPLHVVHPPAPADAAAATSPAHEGTASAGGARGGPAALQSRVLPPPGQRFVFLTGAALAYGCQQVKEAPDAHFKFHAACVVNVCITTVAEMWQKYSQQQQQQQQQQPESLEHNNKQRMASPPPLPPEGKESSCSGIDSPVAASLPPLLTTVALDNLLDLLWASLDEPLAQTLRQFQLIFEALLEALTLQHAALAGQAGPADKRAAITAIPPPPPPGSPPLQPAIDSSSSVGCGSGMGPIADGGTAFLEGVARQLLGVEYTRKGRYARLQSVALRLGAKPLLQMYPSIIREALLATQNEMASSAAALFLKTLLQLLQQECGAVGGRGDARRVAEWHGWWTPSLMAALTSGSDRLRTCVSSHVLPLVLDLEPSTLRVLVSQAMHPNPASPDTEVPHTSSSVAAVLSLLRVGRLLHLLPSLDSAAGDQHTLGVDVEQVLCAALEHSSEAVRIDCLDLVASSPKATEPPGMLELKVAARWLCCCIRSTSAGKRNACIGLLAKLLTRIKAASGACCTRSAGRPAHLLASKRAPAGAKALASAPLTPEERMAAWHADAAAVQRMRTFCQWLSSTLVAYLYPGAPYERKFFALEAQYIHGTSARQVATHTKACNVSCQVMSSWIHHESAAG